MLKSRVFVIAIVVLSLLTVSMYRPIMDNIAAATLGEQNMMAVLYQQKAAEYKALCFQSYNLARLKLAEKLANRKSTDLPPAIVLDIDETLLDNSPYNAKLAKNNQTFNPEEWKKWVLLHQAYSVPGAYGFLHYADSMKVGIYYITNRKVDEMKATLDNMRLLLFPQLTYDHLLVRTDSTNKEPRRKQVAANNEILLLVGDNLNDFTDLYEHKLPYRRDQITDSLNQVFGDRFIVLPNPMYGDWESALYHYDNGLSAEKKDSIRRSNLRLY